MDSWKTPIGRLRHVGRLEGASFLLLLFVAMPLKYFAGLPLAVKLVGSAHGALFVLLIFVLTHVLLTTKFPFRSALLVLVAAFFPFGPFLIDRRLRELEMPE